MTKLHDRHARGVSKTGWLDSQHTFSFGEFNDPTRMGVGNLRVINEDRVIPGAGFPTHGHRDMEILTYVISGALAHKDSLGNGSIIRRGEIQRMSAGRGITHSEMNASETDPVHFLQIWVLPNAKRLQPGYEQVDLLPDAGQNGFTLIAGPDGGDGAVGLNQDTKVFLAKPEQGETLDFEITGGRNGFLQVVTGKIEVSGLELNAGDGLEFSDETARQLQAVTDAEVLLFDT